jgi:Rrf2 family nitric oxide-sensitive transcriptional repressor
MQWSHPGNRKECAMRLTMRTNLAMRVLMFCAVNAGVTVRKQDIAATCNASENHLAQVIHLLARKGYLRTVRGRGGGVRLGRAAETIRVGEVFRTFEAELPFAECFAEGNTCPLAGACQLRCLLTEALAAFYGTLDTVTLRDLVAENSPLDRILKVA